MKIFTNNWFGYVRPTFEPMFRELMPKSILEIGSCEGQSACFMLDTSPLATIICIDSWQADPETHDRFNANTEEYGDRVTVYAGPSIEMLGGMVGEWSPEFDFVYVDGSHTAPDTLLDGLLSWDMLKIGGVVAFDDYTWNGGNNECQRPKIGIDAFIEVMADSIEVMHVGNQVYVRRLA